MGDVTSPVVVPIGFLAISFALISVLVFSKKWSLARKDTSNRNHENSMEIDQTTTDQLSEERKRLEVLFKK